MFQKERMSGHYYSDQTNVIDKLYSPCFSWATKYFRDAGYFSSHIYQAMSKDVLEFILRDKSNHITLFTNIDIYPPDYDAIVNSSISSDEQVYEQWDQVHGPVRLLVDTFVPCNDLDLPIDCTSGQQIRTGLGR